MTSQLLLVLINIDGSPSLGFRVSTNWIRILFQGVEKTMQFAYRVLKKNRRPFSKLKTIVDLHKHDKEAKIIENLKR